jgi:prepilin-type N-terminal cleavage/methylation domain-containing protein
VAKTISKEPKRFKAFTLVEVLIAMAVLGIMVTGIVAGYTQAIRQAEWSAYSLAANPLAMQPIERARAAKWDQYATPQSCMIVASNFALETNILDIPISGTNIVYATNRTTITDISLSPPLKQISVECTWTFMNRGVFTNKVVTFRAPDQ